MAGESPVDGYKTYRDFKTAPLIRQSALEYFARAMPAWLTSLSGGGLRYELVYQVELSLA